MLKRKKQKGFKEEKLEKSKEQIRAEKTADTSADDLAEQIKRASEGLFYTSETDANISAFVGQEAESVNEATLLAQIGAANDALVAEKDFAEFFARLTEIQDWFGTDETDIAKRFVQLKEILERNLRDLKVYKIGKIQLDVYIVGLEAENVLMGVKTQAVET